MFVFHVHRTPTVRNERSIMFYCPRAKAGEICCAHHNTTYLDTIGTMHVHVTRHVIGCLMQASLTHEMVNGRHSRMIEEACEQCNQPSVDMRALSPLRYYLGINRVACTKRSKEPNGYIRAAHVRSIGYFDTAALEDSCGTFPLSFSLLSEGDSAW